MPRSRREDETLTYQQQAEVMAIKRLLENKHFKNAVAVGGGYGYLYSLISQYADIITLVDSEIAVVEEAASSSGSKKHMSSLAIPAAGKDEAWNYKDGTIDLLIMVRFLHQFADPEAQFAEAARVLSADGLMIMEVAAPHDPKQSIRSLAHAGLKVDRILSVASLQGSYVSKFMPGRMLLAVEGLLQPALGRRYRGPHVFLAVRKMQ